MFLFTFYSVYFYKRNFSNPTIDSHKLMSQPRPANAPPLSNRGRTVVVLCGLAGSGKSTAANFLAQEHGFLHLNFADTLKDVVAALFGWERALLEGDTNESRSWRETVDPWWASRLNMQDLTPRWVLQNIGTEVLRCGFHDSIWVAALERKIQNHPERDVVISDARFVNEFNIVFQPDTCTRVIQLNRNPPNWYATAVEAAQGDHLARRHLKHLKIHESEWSFLKFTTTHQNTLILENTGTIESLKSQLNALLFKTHTLSIKNNNECLKTEL